MVEADRPGLGWDTRCGSQADSRRAADWVVCSALGVDRSQLISQESTPVAAVHRYRACLRGSMLARGWPLQYVTASVPFHNIRLVVNPSTLIPRPETEELVDAVLHRLRGVRRPRILDLCCGSGCISLAIKAANQDAKVVGVDNSMEALAVAAENAARLGLHVVWMQANVLEIDFSDSLSVPFDVIVSNPPYVCDTEEAEVDECVRRFEPRSAVFSERPMDFYEAILGSAAGLTHNSSVLLFEVHADRAARVCDLATTAGYTRAKIRRDAAGRERIVEVFGRRAE